MKTKVLKCTILTAITLFILASCYKEIEFNIQPGADKIVVNGLINNLDILSVTVTKSFPSTGDITVDEVKTANVSIYENGVFIENMKYRKYETDPVGKFMADFIPVPDKNYSIIVSDDIMGEVQANTSIPEPVGISDYSAELTDWGKDGWNRPRRYRFSFTLHDPKQKNYYFLRIFMKIYLKETGIDSTKVLTYMNGEVLSSSMPEQMKYVYGGLLFSDMAFNGSDHIISGTATLQDTSLVVNALTGVDAEPGDVIMDIDRLYLQLEVLSEETYRFYKSHGKVLRIVKYSSNYSYKELSPVFENIEDGLGIFGGLNRKIISTWVGGY